MNAEEEIITYYEECNNAYRDAWGMDKNMQLNLGLWKKGTKNLAQALFHLNQEVIQLGGIHSEDKVLDAGCGVGGSAIHLAKETGCHVTGISITPHQIEKAKENAQRHGVEALTDFQIMDYTKTTFADASFDVIIGIESICYANPKMDFLSEAKRLLKPGGRIVLAENLQGKAKLSKEEDECLYANAFNGCKVTKLDTAEEYETHLNTLQFESVQCLDYTPLIRPSIQRLRRFFYPAYLYNLYHRLIGRPFSATQEANTKMCYYLLSSLDRGLWTYGLICAKKPETIP